MPPVHRDDPYSGYNFELVVNGINHDGTAVRGSFAEASGLQVEVEPIEYRNDSEDIRIGEIPGLKKYTNITLKRGCIRDIAMWNWISDGVKGLVNRQDGSIIVRDENRQEVMRFNFTRGWPCNYTGPVFNAESNETALETLEISYEGLQVDRQA